MLKRRALSAKSCMSIICCCCSAESTDSVDTAASVASAEVLGDASPEAFEAVGEADGIRSASVRWGAAWRWRAAARSLLLLLRLLLELREEVRER
ncbi:hypothetical protein AAVH_37567 [Aphelenchoides avenae]|nr:hypothetical protein AAVH_37567 [Aphelenchus avenae]